MPLNLSLFRSFSIIGNAANLKMLENESFVEELSLLLDIS
jgi:hypothetical protein